MKIYPSKHAIIETEKVQHKDTPLAFISEEHSDTQVLVDSRVPNTFWEKELFPYDTFLFPDPVLYKEGRRVSISADLERTTQGFYTYVPPGNVEYSPLRFNVRLLAKRASLYRTDKNYNIKVGCIDKDNEVGERIISIFGDAASTGIAPNNVTVNNGDVSVASLYNKSFEENDFVFIKESYLEELNKLEEPPVVFSEGHANLWVLKDKADDERMTNNDSKDCELAASFLYKTKKHQLAAARTFSPEKIHMFEEGGHHVKYNEFLGNTPIVQTEIKGERHIIYSDISLIENVGINVKLIYEWLIRTYNESYIEAVQHDLWITDDPVDYISRSSGNRHGKRHSSFNAFRAIKEADKNLEKDFSLVKVEPSSADVMFSGISDHGDILFKKSGGAMDPKKTGEQVSFYTDRGTVANYTPSGIYQIKKALVSSYRELPQSLEIEIAHYIDSALGVDTLLNQKVHVPKEESDHVIFLRGRSSSTIEVGKEESLGDEAYILASVKVIKEAKIKNYDARQKGGGLHETEADNFNLLDIGHALGRPYRQGGSIVIRLPKSLKPSEGNIRKEIEKHIASGEAYFLVFEERL